MSDITDLMTKALAGVKTDTLLDTLERVAALGGEMEDAPDSHPLNVEVARFLENPAYLVVVEAFSKKHRLPQEATRCLIFMGYMAGLITPVALPPTVCERCADHEASPGCNLCPSCAAWVDAQP